MEYTSDGDMEGKQNFSSLPDQLIDGARDRTQKAELIKRGKSLTEAGNLLSHPSDEQAMDYDSDTELKSVQSLSDVSEQVKPKMPHSESQTERNDLNLLHQSQSSSDGQAMTMPNITGGEVVHVRRERENNQNDESDSMMSSEMDQQGSGESLTLRPYQTELATPSMKGLNNIICSPTGSGKTFVAAKIMQHHLNQGGIRKILFFANQVALVDQQFQVFKQFLPKERRIFKLSSETQQALKVPFKQLLLRKDIVVMTPQILVDALREGEVSSLSEFTMLIFDECHHTHQKHPYNRIMFNYMDLKLQNSPQHDRGPALPQIVGLTASVGVGKAKNISGAVDHIKSLCANMDARGAVTTVQDHIENLTSHARTVGVDVEKTRRRTEDIFKSIVSDGLMAAIERMMLSPQYVDRVVDVEDFGKGLSPPVERGDSPYINWIGNLKRQIAKIEDQNIRRFFFSCRRMLEIYNKALAVNEDCRTKDAVVYLENKIEELYSSSVTMDRTDRLLKEQFDNMKQDLSDACKNERCVNPKLTRLKYMICKAFDAEAESRCMVFVKTLDLAMSLKQWMSEDPELGKLKPGIFTGQNAPTERGGMTKNQQLDTAKLFKQGNHKIIVATSVAEEGMDFSQCNLVIRYEYVTNEIAMVQARGRARAENSQFIVVTDNRQGTAEKEELNLIREMMMNQGLQQLQRQVQRDPEYFHNEILLLQTQAKAERDEDAKNRKEKTLSEDEFEIRCVKCDILACFSYDFRTVKETNRVVVDPNFRNKIRISVHPKPTNMTPGLRKSHKIFCKKCGMDWGIIATYQNKLLHVPKINSFIIIDSLGRQDQPRGWKNVPFVVQEMSHDELTNFQSLEP